MHIGKKGSSNRGVYRVPLFNYLISPSARLSVSQGMWNVRRFFGLRELYQADFHKRGIYGSVRAWANAWDAFRSTPPQDGRGRRDAVEFVVCFGCGEIYFVFFFSVFCYVERTRPTASMRAPSLIYLSTSNGAVFCL